MKALSAFALMMLAGACVTDNTVVAMVPAARETKGMGAEGDAADDPAIWVNPNDPAKSLILGTNKDEGLYVYNLAGEELQKIPVGMSNNVDLRGNLAVISNDGVNALSWFRIDPVTAIVSHAGDTKLATIEPYGVCIGRLDRAMHVIVTYKTGLVEIWRVTDTGVGPVQISELRTIKFASQIEGCVIDDAAGRMFVGEENVGLWAVDMLSEDMLPKSVDTVGSGAGLVADVEGVTIYAGKEPGGGYLIASAQGADRYVVYDRKPPHAALGVFKVGPGADGKVDGTSVTDGIDASSAPLLGFPAGIFVVQDDANPVSQVDQNFKIVDWREIEKVLMESKAK